MEIKDVEALASLARIQLGEDEKREILSDMKGILDYVKMIEEVKVEDADLEMDVYNITRKDESEKMDFSRDLIIGQFPEKQGDFLKVKKIL